MLPFCALPYSYAPAQALDARACVDTAGPDHLAFCHLDDPAEQKVPDGLSEEEELYEEPVKVDGVRSRREGSGECFSRGKVASRLSRDLSCDALLTCKRLPALFRYLRCRTASRAHSLERRRRARAW